ncbi:MAG: hypothetical protein QM726_26185 [Chitinophagaceae bacterium]
MEDYLMLKPSLQKRQKRRDKRLDEELIECYRGGRGGPKRFKGYRKMIEANGYERALKHEGIKFMHGDTKYFNDNLQPLIRLLESKTGKYWNKVFSEINARLDRSTVSGEHVFNHLFDFVQTKVVIKNKKIIGTDRSGRPMQVLAWSRWPMFYVHPKTGVLHKAPKGDWRDKYNLN